MNISTSSGITIATSHAPARNLLTSSMIVTAKVSTAPTPSMIARQSRSAYGATLPLQYECFTIPVGDRVKPMNTPTANSDQRLGVAGPRTAAARPIVSTMTP